MRDVIITLYVLLALEDFLVIWFARDLLFEFLIGRRNQKSAKMIHSQQSLRNKITMGYIRPLLKRNISEFKGFYRIYIGEITTLFPQYAALLMAQIFIGEHIRFALYVMCVLKGLLFLIIRRQFNASRVSEYRKK